MIKSSGNNQEIKKIIHVDMDAFFAAVEQRDHPELRGKPVIVGGPPNTRSVVATCSYEARKYGIHSAMPSNTAYRLCPHAIFVRGNFREYEKVSRQIREIFHNYTDLVQPLSLDEAYLDVTHNKKSIKSATITARKILEEITEVTRLTASAGVSYNKFLSKIGSDYNKPNGLTVITPEMTETFIDPLPIGKFHGIGKVTEKRMKKLGIYTGQDIKKMGRSRMRMYFGKFGSWFYNMAMGHDPRNVETSCVRKSIGTERTLKEDISTNDQMIQVLLKIAERLSGHLKDKKRKGKTITLKIKYSDFHSITRSLTIDNYIQEAEEIMIYVKYILKTTKLETKPVRLLGISISHLNQVNETDENGQLLFQF